MSRPNNVRGPTSALTEFLRESGITPSTVARRAATRNQEQEQQQNVAGPSAQVNSNNDSEDSNEAPIGPRTRRARARATLRLSGNASDELDESEAEQAAQETKEETPANKKRKLTKAAAAKLKAQQKKKRGIKDSDEDYMDEDDPYTAPSRFLRNTDGGAKPTPGSFETCVKCEKQFTVTVYTMAAVPGPGFLCHPCAKASGNDPFKKPVAARKKKPPVDKRSIVSFEDRRFPTLAAMCIQLITKYIDDVESLGDIGSMNVEAISKAISKNRSLTAENAQLFYNASNTTLTFYDATNLPPDAFCTLAYLNPNLTSLRLDFCGQLNDDVFNVFSSSLPALTEIELLGPFLVRVPAWKAFFESHPNLEKFLITQSPRFDLECLQTLLLSCGKNLRALRLKEVGKLNDDFLQELSKLGENQLTHLDVSDPSGSCSEEAMIALLTAIGKSLVHINLSKHDLLSDYFLEVGLRPHTSAVKELILTNLTELTDKGVARFFENWDNVALSHLDLSRNDALADQALSAILEHSGSALETFNISGWKDLKEDSLFLIGRMAPLLRKVDVGWVREMTDFVAKAWLEGEDVKGKTHAGCMHLEELKVWGCNRITMNCPRKRGLNIYGIEAHCVIRTF